MTFLEIIQSSETTLPIEYKGSFRTTIKDKIRQFGEMIDASDNLSEAVDGIPFKPDIFKRRSKIIREGIIGTIDAYYNGDPSRAFQLMVEFMKKSNLKGYLKHVDEFKKGTDLFRIRLRNGNYSYTKSELFHIPFEHRGKVSTQRFSIPGLPSLYLSNSIYVAWEELKRPNAMEIQAVRVSNLIPLKLLDLTSDIFSVNSELVDNTAYGWQLLYSVMVWPLIAACSVKVENSNDPFKPEYIIPQLLLQWINKSEVYGIKFSSTHIDLTKSKHDGHFYNVVIPVRTFDCDTGQCQYLLNAFESTQVIPLQVRQFLTQSDRLYHQPSISYDVNIDVNSIELIKGDVEPYSRTIFGILEHSLKGMRLEEFKEEAKFRTKF